MGQCLATVQLCPPFCSGYVLGRNVNAIINSYFQRHLAAILQQLETWDKSRSMTDHLSKKYPSLRDNNRTEITISVIISTVRFVDPYSADLTLSAWVLFACFAS